MQKRGQAAMEFLMTYGWAILVVIIAIGALAYFGVLNPGKQAPTACTMQAGFFCEDFNIVSNGVNLVLLNSLPYDIEISYLAFSNIRAGTVCDTTILAPPVEVKKDQKGTFVVRCSPMGTSFSGKLLVTYNRKGSTLGRSSTGSVSGPVDKNQVIGCTLGDTLACPLQAGVCSGSQQICIDVGGVGTWPGCDATTYTSRNGAYQSIETLCDGLDNDCDAQIDEGCPVGPSCNGK